MVHSTMKTNINVAIIGVGNCASALVQGVYYYQKVARDQRPVGIVFERVGPYTIQDIRFVAAFDVDKRKIGKDLAEAIFSPPNNAYKVTEVEPLGVTVKPGILLDGVADQLKNTFIPVAESTLEDVVRELNSANAHVAINFLPTGAQRASETYAEAAIKAGCAFVNAMPAMIANHPEIPKRFEESKLPLAGDDIQNQVGATVLHKAIIHLLHIRGVKIIDTYQINIGGTPDFLNLMYRKEQKEKTKTEAVLKMAEGQEFPAYIAPVAYIPFLGSKKIAHMLIEAQGLAGVPIRIRVDLEVYDPWNNAGIMVDVIRIMKLALDRGVGGPVYSLCAWAFKNPPIHAPPEIARKWVEEFIEGKRDR